jgi:Mlc titration factor MtfA (ptsG expression regulator)
MIALIRVFLVFVAFYLIRNYKRLKHNFLYKKNKAEIERIYHPLLSKHILFYTHLSDEGRSKFMKRVYLFQKTKKFIGKDGIKITEELKCVISASAVQLTFGLKNYLIPHFNVIILYPQPFYSKIFKMRLKGSAARNGIIAFSLIDYYDGYLDDKDNLNLGLHEMAHAFEIDNQYNQKPEIKFDEWKKLTYTEFIHIKQGNENWLRKYAAQNTYEFFAVIIECFFESPEQMELELPDVYYATCLLLNLDPCKKNNDYLLSEQRKKELKRKAFAALSIKRKVL